MIVRIIETKLLDNKVAIDGTIPSKMIKRSKKNTKNIHVLFDYYNLLWYFIVCELCSVPNSKGTQFSSTCRVIVVHKTIIQKWDYTINFNYKIVTKINVYYKHSIWDCLLSIDCTRTLVCNYLFWIFHVLFFRFECIALSMDNI